MDDPIEIDDHALVEIEAVARSPLGFAPGVEQLNIEPLSQAEELHVAAAKWALPIINDTQLGHGPATCRESDGSRPDPVRPGTEPSW